MEGGAFRRSDGGGEAEDGSVKDIASRYPSSATNAGAVAAETTGAGCDGVNSPLNSFLFGKLFYNA